MAGKVTGNGLHRNLISYIGILITFIGAFLTLFSLIVEFSLEAPSPYIGIFSFMIFPAIIAFGVVVILFGMRRESKRRKKLKTEKALPYPSVDLNDPRHRKIFGIIAVGGLFMVLLLGFAGYNAFLFTESNTFCGKVCHSVMEPEYEAYQHSPHARVHCVECHVGSGASFYVKSKLSGVRQVFNVVFNTYEKPIPTPIENLRPAQEVCEECHWPQKFYGAQLLQIPYFRYDEKNTSDQISLLVKTGGGMTRLGQSAGIHWHMIIDNTIIFATPDPKLQEIPWFKVTGRYGQERVYMSRDNPVSEEEPAKLEKHEMDCMDCHNRPTHKFPPPDRAIDLALENGSIDRNIPWVKKITAEALMADYPDHKTAVREIRNGIFNFYAREYPDLHDERKEDIETAVEVSLDIYTRTVFPEMNVDWSTYPVNIGHRNWPGCFRCHDGKHYTEDGKVLSNECTICHTMPQRGPLEELGAMPPVTDESWHPFRLTGKHADILCSECHRAGIRPSSDCRGCHGMPEEGAMASLDCTACHTESGSSESMTECSMCHEASGLHTLEMHAESGCVQCHEPHRWVIENRAACMDCHTDKEEHYPDNPCADCHEFTGS